MGIIKEGKNIKIQVNKGYKIQAGKISEIADKINIEALKENLLFSSGKKVQMHGEEGGVVLDNYTPPELTIEESLYKLESRFALEQLFSFAEKDSMSMFCLWMSDIFGKDIPPVAYEQLYQNASDKKDEINPKITVAVGLPFNTAAYYSGNKQSEYKNHIIVSESFITNALQYPEDSVRLMIALVEEFGHHLDYLLRFQYSSQKGDAPRDEGAKYTSKMNRAYQKYLIDPFKQKEQHYATATIKGEEIKLIWDFSDLHEKLTQYADSRTEKEDRAYADFEFFGAGEGDDLHGYGHQHVEYDAFKGIYKTEKEGEVHPHVKQIYFGNWLRDFSQFIDPMVVRPMANSLAALSKEDQNTLSDLSIETIEKIMDTNMVTHKDKRTLEVPAGVSYEFLPYPKFSLQWKEEEFYPVKLSREAITSFVELIGIKEFGILKETPEDGKPQNYLQYLKDFRSQFAHVTPKLLGVYRPQEHIDNPAALLPKKNEQLNLNHKLDPDFVKTPVKSQWDNNAAYGTKNYIRGHQGEDPFLSAYDAFIQFINQSNPDTVEGRINFGAALHILEDYYAHSNFCELTVMKVWNPKVFPWTNLPQSCKTDDLAKQKGDLSSNRHAADSVIGDRSQIKFKTLKNTELHAPALQEFLQRNPGKTYEDFYRIKGLSMGGNRGTYYSHAECAIVQTGSFGMLDTFASIAPKINNKLLSIEIEDPSELKEGERTLTDALIYEFLKDISLSQALDVYKNNSDYQGTKDNLYSEAFLNYLEFRDFLVAERWFLAGKSFKDIPGLFGLTEYINSYITVIKNVFYHYLALAAINLIDDYQTAVSQQLDQLENGTWKVPPLGPTHTQVAKDNGAQPLHDLSIKLATEAVTTTGKLFKEGQLGQIKDLARDIFFVHPTLTDWMDESVIDWCKDSKNHWNLKIAEEASIVLYGIHQGQQEVTHLVYELKIMIRNLTDVVDLDATQKLNETIPDKWWAIQARINRLWVEKGMDKLYNIGTFKDREKKLEKEKGF